MWHAAAVLRPWTAVVGGVLVVLLGGCASATPSITAVHHTPPVTTPPRPTLSPIPARSADPPTAGPRTPIPTATKPKPTVAKAAGPAQWSYAPAGPSFGSAGTVRRFRVAVENSLHTSVSAFATEVVQTLSDPRSWIAGNNVRFQQVGAGDATNFTIWLASPATAKTICAQSGVNIVVNGVPYTSCRGGSNVVINSDRYFNAVPNYGASLDVYRNYAINHEVGHFLGHGHVLCPGAGMPAPVMQQQTLGLQGCVANGWPYINGTLYSGPPTSG
jgi:hypothetical protein